MTPVWAGAIPPYFFGSLPWSGESDPDPEEEAGIVASALTHATPIPHRSLSEKTTILPSLESESYRAQQVPIAALRFLFAARPVSISTDLSFAYSDCPSGRPGLSYVSGGPTTRHPRHAQPTDRGGQS
jgi:hypothetical protein